MTTLEQDIITEAKRLHDAGLSADQAYGWAKRWRYREFKHRSPTHVYDEFIKALSVTLNR